ncbi:MAG: hypothetical protein ACD_3C00156G0003 [uncultured bacterium (gcode 4)]|uniref:Uncharacterized protein n=1 Tax=uncultured bacterium (gcode 4) TaxID=1234023 RepID=K2GWN2_9BACT|nr:MAG: hypothetical protein ACD_3C00156G0003 [uncultured bacterium (gcode 4)]
MGTLFWKYYLPNSLDPKDSDVSRFNRTEESRTVQNAVTNFRFDVEGALDAIDSLVWESFEWIVADGEKELNWILEEAKRKPKFEKKDFLVPKLSRMIDDEAKIQNRWARMPFLEEKSVDNPDYEDIFAMKKTIVSKEVKIFTRSLDVEVLPEPIKLQMRLNDDYWLNYRKILYSDDYLKHLMLFFNLIWACQKILNEKITVWVVSKSWEEALLNEDLLKNLKTWIEFDFSLETTDKSIIVFDMTDGSASNFDYFSQCKDIHPFESSTILMTNKFKSINMKEKLTRTRTIVMEYLLSSLKDYYEF